MICARWHFILVITNQMIFSIKVEIMCMREKVDVHFLRECAKIIYVKFYNSKIEF